MNKLSFITSICLVGYIFYLAYGPRETLKQQIENSGIDFEYVTDEGSCFTQRADPVGPGSQRYILSLQKLEPSTSKQEPLYVMVGYIMKEVRLKNKSNAVLLTNKS